MNTKRTLLLMASICALLAGAISRGAAAPNVDFNNFTYAHNPCAETPITMTKGSGEYSSGPGDPSFTLDMGAVYKGTLGGRATAVVVISCGLPVGSISSADAYAIDGSHATYLVHLGRVDASSGGYPPATWIHVRFSGDLLYADVLTNPEADPERWTVTTYRLSGDKLTPVNVLVHKRT
jgi:hypothetical protein